MSDANFEDLRTALAELSRLLRESGALQRRLRTAVRTAIERFGRFAKVQRQRERRAAHWPSDPRAFGKAMRYMRQAEKLSQGQLGDMVGVSYQTIARIESGERCWPTTRDWIIEAFERLEQKRATYAGSKT